MTASTQEVHIGTLLEALNPVRDISKNWGIDLAQHLETYLEQIALENGMNFAEAALLIQNSAVIYVKKVDYVWHISQQLLESLRKRKFGEENKKAVQTRENDDAEHDENDAEAPQNNKKNKKNKEVDKSKYGEINIEVSEKLLELEPSKEKRKPWKLMPDVYHQFQKRPLSRRRPYAYSEPGDLEDEHKFKVNQPLLSNLALHHELHEEHRAALVARPSFFIPVATCDATLNDVAEVHDDAMSHCGDNDDCPADPCPAEPRPADPCPAAIDAERSDPVEAPRAADVWEPIPLDEADAAGSYPDKKPARLKTVKLPCDPKLLDLDAPLKRKADGSRDAYEHEPAPLLARWLRQGLVVRMALLVDDEFVFRLVDEIQDKTVAKKRDSARKNRRKFDEIRPQMEEEFSEFDDFRGFEDYESTCAADLNGFRGFCDEEEDECPGEDDHPYDDDRPADAYHLDPPPRLDADEILAQDAAEEVRAHAAMEALARGAEGPGAVDHAELARRVCEWHESIRHRLVDAEGRGHYDIHKYGTEIIEKFPGGGGRHTMRLQQLVRDVDTRDVSRYFLAALMLANTYNIEISTPREELTMDRMELTLLTARRFHEQLEEYVAPSQEGTSGVRICSSSVHLARPHSSGTPSTTTTRNLPTSRKRKM